VARAAHPALIADGVTVNSILPTNRVTKGLESLLGGGTVGSLVALPAKRGGLPRDSGKADAFLCSDRRVA
jgi:NAD(P)-dependent dehydrogenase (short-subunit alcohol dehydrogenase family)